MHIAPSPTQVIAVPSISDCDAPLTTLPPMTMFITYASVLHVCSVSGVVLRILRKHGAICIFRIFQEMPYLGLRPHVDTHPDPAQLQQVRVWLRQVSGRLGARGCGHSELRRSDAGQTRCRRSAGSWTPAMGTAYRSSGNPREQIRGRMLRDSVSGAIVTPHEGLEDRTGTFADLSSCSGEALRRFIQMREMISCTPA